MTGAVTHFSLSQEAVSIVLSACVYLYTETMAVTAGPVYSYLTLLWLCAACEQWSGDACCLQWLLAILIATINVKLDASLFKSVDILLLLPSEGNAVKQILGLCLRSEHCGSFLSSVGESADSPSLCECL